MTCAVLLQPPDASPAWVSAVHDVEARIRDGADTDCAAIAVDVGQEGATVSFTTRDGRRAQRHVASAPQLRATVDALLITTGGVATTAPTGANATSTPPPPQRYPSAVNAPLAASDHAATTRSPSAIYVIASVLGGARLSAPTAYVSPSVDVRAAFVVSSWEIGVYAHGEPAHLWLDGPVPAGYWMWRYEVGASFARRQVVSRAAILLFGVNASASIFGQGTTTDQGQNGTEPLVEPYVGAFAGAVFPERSRIRIRCELLGELAVARGAVLGGNQTSLPPLPWVSAGLAVGLEGVL